MADDKTQARIDRSMRRMGVGREKEGGKPAQALEKSSLLDKVPLPPELPKSTPWKSADAISQRLDRLIELFEKNMMVVPAQAWRPTTAATPGVNLQTILVQPTEVQVTVEGQKVEIPPTMITVIPPEVVMPTSMEVAGQVGVQLSKNEMSYMRWGWLVEPRWHYGNEMTAPVADKELVWRKPSTSIDGKLYGVYINAGEANSFQIEADGQDKFRLTLSSAGVLLIISPVPLVGFRNRVAIKNITAGSAGIVYQAHLLWTDGDL